MRPLIRQILLLIPLLIVQCSILLLCIARRGLASWYAADGADVLLIII